MPCPPGLCAYQADCADRHCPGHPHGSGEHSDYWPRVNADYEVEGPHRARAGLTVPEYLAGAFALVVIVLALAHYFGFF